MTNHSPQYDAPLEFADAGGLLRGLLIAAPLSAGLWLVIAICVQRLVSA